jgi:hypothetical protein
VIPYFIFLLNNPFLNKKSEICKENGGNNVFCTMNTYSNRRVANHLHGLIFELKERMNSRQDRPVMQKKEKEKTKNLFQAKTLLWLIKCLLCELTLKPLGFNTSSPKSVC